MSGWEADDERRLMQLLVGDYYGDRPEEKLDEIRVAKKERAADLCRKLGCNKESVVLEVGSGMGFTSIHVATEVKYLHCCDISASFLNMARKECAGVGNIEFMKLDSERPPIFSFADEFFDIIFADAVFIHLNLYDIFWYFSEFQRLAKKRGKVYINVMNASKIDLDKFSEMAGYYRRNKGSLERLLCWNSTDAVATIAAHFGFKLTAKAWLRRLRPRDAAELLFMKR